ncbi:MAG: hypothetical protein GX862_11270 [Leucobacter sp.]|nr:hypothetical protein [Leucobacter sp.]
MTPLTTSLAIAPSSIVADAETTVTARIENTNDDAQDLSTVTIALPAGVTYVAGSTVGLPEPTVGATGLVFDGTGVEIAADGALQFTFKVTSSVAGVHTLNLSAVVESRVDVTPSSAQLTVGAPELPIVSTFDPGTVTAGDRSTLVAGVLNEHDVDFTLDELVVTLPAGATYVAGSADGLPEPTMSGSTLVFAGPILVEADSLLPFIIEVNTTAPGALVFTLAGTAAGANVLNSQATLNVEAVLAKKDPSELAQTGADGSNAMALGAIAGVLLLGSAVAVSAATLRRNALK